MTRVRDNLYLMKQILRGGYDAALRGQEDEFGTTFLLNILPTWYIISKLTFLNALTIAPKQQGVKLIARTNGSTGDFYTETELDLVQSCEISWFHEGCCSWDATPTLWW